MGKEVHIGHKTIAVRLNGQYHPTNRGRDAHELRILARALSRDGKRGFSIGPELRQKYAGRMEALCVKLDLPKDEGARKNTIRGLSGRLTQLDMPISRVFIK